MPCTVSSFIVDLGMIIVIVSLAVFMAMVYRIMK